MKKKEKEKKKSETGVKLELDKTKATYINSKIGEKVILFDV